MSQKRNKALTRRLVPLYVSAFSHGFILWYAVEKLFMKSIGYNDASIGFMIAFYSAIMLAVETPSGILADRWSRKGVLILASIALAVSTLVGGLSDNVPMYLLCAGLWGVFFAMYSGTYESIFYDTVMEETKSSKDYEYYLGRFKIVDSAALVIGSILGGLIAEYLGLRQTYFLTIPLVLLSIGALMKFKEPRLHKSHVAMPVVEHVRSTFGAILKKAGLGPIVAMLITNSVIIYTLFEFTQLWVIALAAPIVLYGPINALYLSTIGIGGALANRLKLHRRPVMFTTLAVMAASSLAIVYSRNLALAVLSITTLLVCVIALDVVFTHLLHDSLQSNIRAGASSAISTLGRMIMIPLSLAFGYISEQASVFQASWMFVALALLLSVFVIRTYSQAKRFSPAELGDELTVDTYNK